MQAPDDSMLQWQGIASPCFCNDSALLQHICSFPSHMLPLCAAGIITDEARKRQQEIRAKLTTMDAKDRPSYTQAKDYYTSEEAAQFQKPKKKVRLADAAKAPVH